MDKRLAPIALGFAAGPVGLALPGNFGFVIVIVAAGAAGWVLPDEPIQAALLFVLPPAALGAGRLLLTGASVPLGALALGLVLALMFAAFFTHIGAGLALRRRRAGQGG